MKTTNFKLKPFVLATLITSIWINISEVFRYFVLVMPRIKSFFNHKTGIADMDLGIFTIWGLWDMLLTAILVFMFWLYAQWAGFTLRSALVSGTIVWLSVFVIFW